MTKLHLFIAILLTFNQASIADLIDEPAIKALSPEDKDETLSNFATWRDFCGNLKADATYNLAMLEHFGAVHFNCVCSDVTVAMRSPRKLPGELSPLDRSAFSKAGGTCPASAVKAVKENTASMDHCANKVLPTQSGGKANLAELTKKGMVAHAKQKDRDELRLNEPTNYTGTLAEFKSAPGILYLGHLPQQLKQFHLVEIKDGKLYQQGKPLDTAGAIHVVEPNGPERRMPKAIFVIDKNGNLYVSKMSIRDKFHHSTFLSGDDIVSAGMIIVKEGKILYIDNESGHYLPKECHFKNGIMVLKEKGYSFDDKVNYKIIK